MPQIPTVIFQALINSQYYHVEDSGCVSEILHSTLILVDMNEENTFINAENIEVIVHPDGDCTVVEEATVPSIDIELVTINDTVNDELDDDDNEAITGEIKKLSSFISVLKFWST